MTKSLGLTITTLLLLFARSPIAQGADYTYTTNNGTITITGGCPSSPGTLTIPDTINGLPVTSIGDRAFSYWLRQQPAVAMLRWWVAKEKSRQGGKKAPDEQSANGAHASSDSIAEGKAMSSCFTFLLHLAAAVEIHRSDAQ